MSPRKKELTENIDSPEGTDVAGSAESTVEPTVEPITQPTAEPPAENQAAAPSRSRRKSAKTAPDETATADATADAPTARKRPARKKAEAQVAAEETSSPEPSEQPGMSLQSLLAQGKLRKKERNETHNKDRVFIRKDLKTRLDALAENRGKGFKTLLINYGLEKALDELEQANMHIDEQTPDSI